MPIGLAKEDFGVRQTFLTSLVEGVGQWVRVGLHFSTIIGHDASNSAKAGNSDGEHTEDQRDTSAILAVQSGQSDDHKKAPELN